MADVDDMTATARGAPPRPNKGPARGRSDRDDMAIDHIEDMKQQLRTAFEAGKAPWYKAWKVGNTGGPARVNGVAYTGGNAAWLATMGAVRGYESDTFGTSKQFREEGCPLDPAIFEEGAPRQHVTACRPRIVKDREDPTKQRVVGYAWYRVYNGDLAQGWTDPVREVREIPEPDAAAAAVLGIWGGVQHGGGRAFYQPSADAVTLPPRDAFETLADYVGTGCHEKAHQSGHRKRLAREGVTNPVIFGDHTYAAEELVAESAASFLLGHLGLQTDAHLNNSGAYLRSWFSRLEDDPSTLMSAMSQGVRAAEYILRAAGLAQ